MIDLDTSRTLLEYTDWSTRQLLECAAPLGDADLDKDLEIGPGSLRRILVHTYNGESVWLKRWQGNTEARWPSESEAISVKDLEARFEREWVERDRFLAMLPPSDVVVPMTYRDSKGSMFKATLGSMIMQAVLHSKHHQAQACNALRRLGARWPELDFMMRIRQPV
jgi:uncharacterized damage-inducible protein DinB